MQRTLGLAQANNTSSVLKTWFAPYEDTRKPELALLDEVIAARKADPRTFQEGQNPYKINYAVYNISSQEILEKLAEANRAGVDVQVLIEEDQLDPQKTWNDGDDYLIRNGFEFAPDHKKLTPEERHTADLIGINNSTLMHLKTRIFQYPDPQTGDLKQTVLTGSMNPGESAIHNDENLMQINDPRVARRYIEMYEAVRDGKEIKNDFDPQSPINVMFTGAPVKDGQSVTRQIFNMIDQEKEAIFLSVFTLRNLTTDSDRQNLVDKLKAAHDRGVPVVVITDKKQSDGVDAQGNRTFSDDQTEDLLQKAGIPTYEALNPSGPFNAMHAKSAIFGLSDIKVITDTGNWTKAALSGRGSRYAQNEESYLFVDSGKLDNNQTGMRYLGNFLNLLRAYAPQNPDQPAAEELINKLSSHPAWPRVKVDFSVMAHTFMGQDIYITGNHPAVGNWTQDGPGLKLNTSPGRYPFWESGGALELPFGSQFEYKIVKREPNGSLQWEAGPNAFLIVDPTDARYGQGSGNTLLRSDDFTPR